MSAHAAAEIWKSHPDSQVIIPGESPFGSPDTGDLMVDHVKTVVNEDPNFAGVSSDSFIAMHSLIDGRGLNNTYLQSEGIAEYLGGNSDGVLGVRLGYHWRPQRALRTFGMTPPFVSAESILMAHGITEYEADH